VDAAPPVALADALRRPRYEVIPLAGIVDEVVAHVPRELTVTVTASPTRGLEPTLATSEQLAGYGYRAVPHLSARLVVDEAHMKDVLQRLAAAGIDDVFVVAGDADVPAGAYGGALDLLAAMAEASHRLSHIGVTGYPESHAFIPDDVTIQAMWDKRRYATYIVSQVCFDPKVISRWIRRVRTRGVTLPIHVGVPGVVSRTKLLRISRKIGIGESARFLNRHRGWLGRALRKGGYAPDRVVDGLATIVAEPGMGVDGLHVYTFNELAQTEAWRRRRLGVAD
jgi:methylenetetrahydrofolate reductase (NADPH)